MQSFFVEMVTVFFNEVEKVDDHVCLRAVGVSGGASGSEIGVVGGKIRMDPYSYPSTSSNKDHLLDDIKIAHFLIEQLKALESCFCQIQLISQRNIINFLKSQIHLLRIK